MSDEEGTNLRSPCFQMYPGDWLSSERVAMMTLEEEGAYIRALLYCWKNYGLPSDVKRLAILIGKGCTVELATKIAAMFEPSNVPDRLTNNRLELEWRKQRRWREMGVSGNQKRWGKNPPNAVAGPHPVKAPDDPPPNPSAPPSIKFPVEKIMRVRAELNRLFERKPEEGWSYYEESGLGEILKRENIEDELAIVVNFRRSIPMHELKFMFPSTLGKLVNDWTGTLDKARSGSYSPEKPRKSDPNVFRYGRATFTKETPPKREDFKDDSSFSGCMAMYQKWLETPKPPTGA